MLVLLWMLMCSSVVALPYALVALTIGRGTDACVIVGIYVALGAVASRATPERPIGAEPTRAPHLTLVHPHGVLCVANVVLCAGDRLWNAARRRERGAPHFVVTGSVAWLTDLMNRAFSCRCSSSSRASVTALMRQQKDIFLYPGGFREAARHSHHTDVVDVGSRGAIRLALIHGYAVRVAFAFGERKTAYNFQGFWRFRLWLAKRGVPAVVPFLLPLAKTPTVAFSPTIQFPVVTDPTDDDVETWHAAYVEALRALHARYKAPDDVLVVHGLKLKVARQQPRELTYRDEEGA
jgi:hypothetical protein